MPKTIVAKIEVDMQKLLAMPGIRQRLRNRLGVQTDCDRPSNRASLRSAQ